MAGGLEEPILSTLGKENDVAGTFMNAFFKASQVSAQKQKLETQLMAMETNSRLREQQQALNLTKMQMDYGFKTAANERAIERLSMDSAYKDRSMALSQQNSANKYEQGQNLLNRGAQYSDEVAALNQTAEPGTRAWGAGYQAIHTKYQDFLQTPQGQRLDNDNIQWHTQGALQRHRDASEAHQKFQDNLTAIGKSKDFNLDDFTHGQWGTKGTTGGSKWIATDKNGARLSPEQVDAMPNPTAAGVQFHTLDPANYRLQKSLADSVMKYAGGDPNKQPDIVQQPTDSVGQAKMIMNDPEASAKAKSVAAKVLGLNQ